MATRSLQSQFPAADINRRILLKVGGAGMLGLNLPGLLRAAENLLTVKAVCLRGD